MAFTFYDNASSATILSAPQNAILGDMTGNFVTIPGCLITLTVGTWLVTATAHFRCWHVNATYAKSSHGLAITDSGGTMINGMWYTMAVDAQNEQNSNAYATLSTIINVPSGTMIILLRGQSSMVVGTNFASGFRWDSGPGQPAQFRAVKIGA